MVFLAELSTWGIWGVWILTSLLMITGLIGSIVPLLPGPVIILLGAVIHQVLRPESGGSWWTIGGLVIGVVAAYALDFISGAMGTKAYGGSRWGIAGVLIGGLVGLFFSLPGLILGPLIGGFAFEMLFAGKPPDSAARSSWGTFLGTGLGLVLRFAISLVMVGLFLADIFWW
jgi:uncharacterized protein